MIEEQRRALTQFNELAQPLNNLMSLNHLLGNRLVPRHIPGDDEARYYWNHGIQPFVRDRSDRADPGYLLGEFFYKFVPGSDDMKTTPVKVEVGYQGSLPDQEPGDTRFIWMDTGRFGYAVHHRRVSVVDFQAVPGTHDKPSLALEMRYTYGSETNTPPALDGVRLGTYDEGVMYPMKSPNIGDAGWTLTLREKGEYDDFEEWRADPKLLEGRNLRPSLFRQTPGIWTFSTAESAIDLNYPIPHELTDQRIEGLVKLSRIGDFAQAILRSRIEWGVEDPSGERWKTIFRREAGIFTETKKTG